MSDSLRIRYRIGEIEFEAEGSTQDVDKQRLEFMSSVLPVAVEAMARAKEKPLGEELSDGIQKQLIVDSSIDEDENAIDAQVVPLARMSLPSFIKEKGVQTDLDFVLFSAYYYEIKVNDKLINVNKVRNYFSLARKPVPSNPSAILFTLASKGLILQSENEEKSKGKTYILSDEGLSYIENFNPLDSREKNSKHVQPKKKTKTSSIYESINIDDLNLASYPEVRRQSGAKNQVLLAMYIVTTKNQGEWFSVDDVVYLLNNVFEVSANYDFVNGVFKRNKSLFQTDKDSKNGNRKKLYGTAKKYVEDNILNKPSITDK